MNIYPKGIQDSVKSLSNYQWHLPQSWSKTFFKICMETQKTLKSQSNVKKEQSWRTQALTSDMPEIYASQEQHGTDTNQTYQWKRIENPHKNPRRINWEQRK